MLGSLDPYVERVIFGESPYDFFHNEVSFKGQAPFHRREMTLFSPHLSLAHKLDWSRSYVVLEQRSEQAFKDAEMLLHLKLFRLRSQEFPMKWCLDGLQVMYQLETLDLSQSTVQHLDFLKDLLRLETLYFPNTDPAYTFVSTEAIKCLANLTHVYVANLSTKHIDGLAPCVYWNVSNAVQSFLKQLPCKDALITLQLLQKKEKEYKICDFETLRRIRASQVFPWVRPFTKKIFPL